MAKKNESSINIFTQKKALIEVLESLSKSLDSLETDATHDYRVVGKEEEQATDWRTGELLWEDAEQTIPRYRDKYDYCEIPTDELSDEARAKVAAIFTVRKALEGMV